ncbi:hypothetical protein ZWY2020_010153 [Hordeum vulgare]|nr:hypothetical protein ZWY2020_010153 [Hordeum vulgare]
MYPPAACVDYTCCSHLSPVAACLQFVELVKDHQDTLSTLFSLYIRDLDALSSKDLPIAMTFPISRGLADHNLDVCGRMINAGILIIDKHGKENVPLLLPIFESYLNKRASNEETCDLVREGVVIYWCSSKTSIEDVLNTPSEAVQRPVSDCLSPLMLSKQVFASVASFY